LALAAIVAVSEHDPPEVYVRVVPLTVQLAVLAEELTT
jgi:hypothetical protein